MSAMAMIQDTIAEGPAICRAVIGTNNHDDPMMAPQLTKSSPSFPMSRRSPLSAGPADVVTTHLLIRDT
ncbi:hypothetical protein [Mycolicibacterium goodii]|uniref:hypothetical protein n=1 Tax=Mycolicibacterium goodii TaxID=134601 RepID=UPI00296EE7D7